MRDARSARLRERWRSRCSWRCCSGARRAVARAVRARAPVRRLSVRAADAPARRRRPTGAGIGPSPIPLRVVDPIERRYAEDRTRRVTLASGGRRSRGSCSAATRSAATSCRACSSGARLSLGIALLADAPGARRSARAVGAAAGYAGGWVDARADADRRSRHRAAGDLRGARAAGRAAAGADRSRRCSSALVAVLALRRMAVRGTRSTRNRPRRTAGRSTQKLRARSARDPGA